MTSKRAVLRTPDVPAGPHDSGVSLVGGHPVLDFANTVAWRLDPARTADRVRGVEAWARWAVAAGLLTADRAEALLRAEVADSTPSTGATAGLLDLRAALWPVLDALVEDEEPPAAEWEALRRRMVLAREDAALPPAFPLRWRPGTDRLDDLRHVLALRTEDLLSGDGLGRVRRCEGPGCGWFFLDRSRSGTRRWCSSQDCGNRDRARRHYSRTRQRG
ncbi:CGNR zinc finger domain-containing protein [Streptomyces californicus]|uniref:CGNR zinc finger domain-containing protein n=1 Tax=Streptomyces californicus TaxID=67351 RepID=UPI00296EE7D3|nr:CGNR zinc finger domain-containing protein [Streptomyces californicus]MDW4897128.1 CGNR zinc finger domain-containing protein [Streptomyces californicus]